MKKYITLTLVFILTIGNSFAQQEKGITGYDNWLNTWTDFKPSKVDYGEANQILTGEITKDLTLTKRNTYLLLGDVFVSNNATLTIEPGTIILGDYKTKGSLVITKGARIIADGTNTDPIIFSSNRDVKKPGDWGGVFVLGEAPTNKYGNESSLKYGLKTSSETNTNYGGEDYNSDSGILRYVRIEFAGKRTKSHGYFNGLTLAGIGMNTVLDNIMVSYCEGVSFSVLGGNLLLDKLVSYKSSIHDYKFNYGALCKISNSLAVKSPYVSGSEISRAMYVSAYDDIEDTDLAADHTTIEAENLTLYNQSKDLDYDIKLGLVNEAIFIGDDTSFSIDNSVISGFNPAVILDDKIRINSETLDKIKFSKTYFNNCNGNIFVRGNQNNEDLENWYGSRSFNNVYSKGPDSETFIDTENSKRPDFRLRINRIIASNGDND